MKVKVTMGFDLQPDGVTAGLAGHCQPDKKYLLRISIVSERKRNDLSVCFKEKQFCILSSDVVK